MKLYSTSALAINFNSTIGSACHRNGLIQITRPSLPSIHLAGENLLLPSSATDHRTAYASIAYVVSACGRKALPVISRTVWSTATVSPEGMTPSVLEDLAEGIEFAKANIADSVFTIDGAIEAARRWIREHRATMAASDKGSIVLLGSGRVQALSRATTTQPVQVTARSNWTLNHRAQTGLRLAA